MQSKPTEGLQSAPRRIRQGTASALDRAVGEIQALGSMDGPSIEFALDTLREGSVRLRSAGETLEARDVDRPLGCPNGPDEGP